MITTLDSVMMWEQSDHISTTRHGRRVRTMARYGFDITRFAVCSCCLLKAANDDTSGHDDSCEGQPAPLSELHDYAGTLHAEGEEGDLGFSWTACEGCGSTLGGDRYTLVGMVERTMHPVSADIRERLAREMDEMLGNH